MAERDLTDILDDAPDNWGKWGATDERGAVNYLTNTEVLRAAEAIDQGEVFTLGVPLNREEGDPVWPGRSEPEQYMLYDKGHFESGKESREGFGGLEAAADVLHVPTHATTHVDALGHVWYDDQLYNGFDASTTMGGLDRGDITGIADHGIVGRGVLLDVARHRDVDHLEAGERITLEEVRECAVEQGVDLEKRDIPVLRTGWVEIFYEEGPETFYADEFTEPGLTYSDDLVEWFHEMEIPAFATDTIANELTYSPETGTYLPLHPALLRDQGVVFNEIVRLDDLAADCADDGKYDFMYVVSPLKVVRGTGSPVNPIAIK